MLALLKKRRSIRKYKDQEIEQDKIDQLIKAALLAPSSKSFRPWEFIVVTDKNMLTALSVAKENGALFLKNAPLGIVVIGDTTKSDVWVEDASIASILIQLTAETLGLGSCWIQIRNRMYNENKTADQHVKELLHIPSQYQVQSIIAIGYPDETRKPYDDSQLNFDKVHENSF